MTPRQHRAAIKTALDLAESELREAKTHTGAEHQAAWVTAMVASKLFSGIAAILINMEPHNGPTEKNIPEL